MADSKISQLPPAATLTGAELVPVVQSGISVRSTVTAIGANAAYTPPGIGAVTRTVSAKLNESVSVLDFGADPTGVADSSSAFTNAAAVYRDVVIPQGVYLLNSAPTVGQSILQYAKGSTFSGAGAASLLLAANAGDQFIQENTAGTDYATRYIRRQANHSGGTPGFVSAGLRVDVFTSAGAANYEWAITGVVDNAATGGQNVGGYFKGIRRASCGPTWGSVAECRDLSGNANPSSGHTGLEVDLFADGTDSGSRRVGIDVVGAQGLTSGPTITYGVRVGPQFGVPANCNFLNGLYLYGVMTRGINIACSNAAVGIDISSSTLTNSAIRLAQSQFIGFDGSDTNQLSYDGTGLGYRVSSALASRLNADGSIGLGGSTLPVILKGTTNTGASAPVLTANKPGAGTAISTWLSVTVNGTQLWIPAWSN